MKISNFLTDVYFLEHDIADSTRSFYRFKLAEFDRYLKRPATLDDLDSQTVNRYIEHRLKTRKRDTVRGDRSTLVAIRNYADERRLLTVNSGRVKPLKKTTRTVVGLTDEQLSKLLTVSAAQPGTFKGTAVSRGAFWTAVVWAFYDTGLRLSDLRNIDTAQISGVGTIIVRQRKTGKLVEVPISRETIDALEATGYRSRPKPFGILCHRNFQEQFAEIFREAGIVVPFAKSKLLRRTSGSMIEREHPGEGHLHLGNTRQVFEAHYNVRAITMKPPRLPPRPKAG